MYIYRLVNFFIGVYVYVNFVYYKLFRKKDVYVYRYKEEIS